MVEYYVGEMNADQLWETTMNPDSRRLIQVTVDDAQMSEEVVALCMSENSGARREWIMENSGYAELDV